MVTFTPEELGAIPVAAENTISPDQLGAVPVSPEELGAVPVSQTSPTASSFKSTLTKVESGDDYEAANPNSTARGRYQFVKATGDALAKKLGVGTDWAISPNDTPEQKEYKKKAQDRMFDVWEKETLIPGAASLEQIPAAMQYTTPQLKAMVHYLGLGGAKQFLKSGVDPAIKTKGNIPTEQYVSKFKDAGGVSAEDLGAIPSTEMSTVEKLKAGLQRQFAPFTMSQAEAEASYSLPAIGTNIAASIATYAGLPALGTVVAGPVGTAVGTVGAVGLGIYSALGEEYANAKVSKREYDYKKAAVNVLVEANPLALLGKATKAGRAVAAISQAGLQAEQARQYGAESGGIALAGILGIPGGAVQAGAMRKLKDRALGVEVAAAHKIANPSSKLTREQAEAFIESTSGKAGNEMRDAIAKRMDDVQAYHQEAKKAILPNLETSMIDVVEDGVKASKLEGERMEFVNWLNDLSGTPNKTSPLQGAMDAIKHQGFRADELFDVWRESKIINKEFLKRASKKVEDLSGEVQEAFKGSILDKVDDLRNVAIKTDRSTGVTKIERVIDEVAESHNRYSNDSAIYTTQLDQLLKKTKKAGLSRKQFSNMMKKVDEARLKHLDSTPEVRAAAIENVIPMRYGKIVEEWREFSDSLHQYGVKAGMFEPSQYIEHYVPHIRVDQPTMISRLRREVGRLETDAAQQGINVRLLLNKDAYKDLKNVISRTTNFGDDINIEDLAKFKDALSSPKFIEKASDAFDAASTHSREYKIPQFLLEDDVGRSFARYIQSLSRTKHMSTPLSKLKSEVAILEKLGMKKTVKYWDKYISNMYGKKFGLSQQTSDAVMKWKAFISKNADEMQREMWAGEKLAYNAPEFASWMMGSAYANLLGFSNVYAPIRNLGQPQVMTARELISLVDKAGLKSTSKDARYMHKIATQAQFKSFMSTKGRLFKGINKFKQQLVKEGRAPGDYIGEGSNVLESSLRNIPKFGKIVEWVDGMNSMGMKMYEASDIVNRWTTRQMGKDLTRDALKGNGIALKSLANIGGDYGTQIRRGLKSRNAGQVEDAVIDYLLGKTQFHYGSHALSEFGRDYGKMVSMFTKWPASVGGEMIDMAKQKQFRAMFVKYFSPIGGLFIMQQGIEAMSDEGDNKTRQAFLGKSLVDLSPMWAAGSIINLPPVVSSVKEAISLGQGALRGDLTTKDVDKKIRNITLKWVPIAGSLHTAQKRWGHLAD